MYSFVRIQPFVCSLKEHPCRRIFDLYQTVGINVSPLILKKSRRRQSDPGKYPQAYPGNS